MANAAADARDEDAGHETHAKSGEWLRDAVLGMSDGLTVPFALAAGVSGAVASNTIVITAGIAEIAAGAISMGLGGYLAARTEAEQYDSEYAREMTETEEMPAEERAEVRGIFKSYGITGEPLEQLVETIASDRERWVDFMMRHELGLEKPAKSRARNSAVTIGFSYMFAGIVPLVPYFFIPVTHEALLVSVVVTLIALFGFGWFKSSMTGTPVFTGALQAMLIGGLAAGVAFGLARLITGHSPA
jgi:VIT1/CCC1 family predicted Fe2+/Mn2+ transporter